ncbi:transposase [Thermoflexus hugenholtzii]
MQDPRPFGHRLPGGGRARWNVRIRIPVPSAAPTTVERDPETGEERRRTACSNNYRKAALRLARAHRRVRNIPLDFLHQFTTGLAKAKSVLVVEDLNVRGLARNPHLS